MAWTEEPTPATRASVETRPRLLVVGPLPPPPGGGETVTKVLIESSLKEKYELRHFDTSRRVSKETMGHWTLANARWALRYYSQFRRVVREFRPDIVHLPIASNKPATIRDALFSATAARYGAKIVMHNHSGHFAERWEQAGKLWRSFVRKHLSRASAMVCLTPFWKEFFDGLHIGFLTEVIYNPVNRAICEPKGLPELKHVGDRIGGEFPRVSFTLVGGRIGDRNRFKSLCSAEAFAAACDRLYQRVLAGGRG
ncbi:MAG: hypothetical protein KatS3mg015_0100 [Fimbriimonadales bacterium]|nr:MAG: hypothetical protein KatS3mg015_0100 [Fimbriimonadales bacterium]